VCSWTDCGCGDTGLCADRYCLSHHLLSPTSKVIKHPPKRPYHRRCHHIQIFMRPLHYRNLGLTVKSVKQTRDAWLSLSCSLCGMGLEVTLGSATHFVVFSFGTCIPSCSLIYAVFNPHLTEWGPIGPQLVSFECQICTRCTLVSGF